MTIIEAIDIVYGYNPQAKQAARNYWPKPLDLVNWSMDEWQLSMDYSHKHFLPPSPIPVVALGKTVEATALASTERRESSE